MPINKIFPRLFKKTSTGADQFWEISTQENTILTRWGQVGGAEQETIDVIAKGKNVGKKNETSPVQQAQAEAQAQWEKKLKKGYVQNIDDARAEKVDAIIQGGINPMLAHKYGEHAAKIVWPAFTQPKLDGHRCIAVIKAGKATLWTRTRKPITGVPHIINALEKAFPGNSDVTLDGELYNHSYKNDFEKITSLVRQEIPAEGHQVVQYHVYDTVLEGSFEAREIWLRVIWAKTGLANGAQDPLVLVPTYKVEDEEALMEKFEFFLANGYEGAMVRNALGPYVNKRSYDLLKVKEFSDDEFEVIGVEAGRGKMVDKAIFVCKTKDGTEFRVKMKGTLDELARFLLDPSLAVGKMLTVQYQGITGASKVPRFPIGIRFREDI